MGSTPLLLKRQVACPAAKGTLPAKAARPTRAEDAEKVHGTWCYLYRAIEASGNLVE
jgi:hypothetical protein